MDQDTNHEKKQKQTNKQKTWNKVQPHQNIDCWYIDYRSLQPRLNIVTAGIWIIVVRNLDWIHWYIDCHSSQPRPNIDCWYNIVVHNLFM